MRVAGKVLPLVAVLMFIAGPAVSQDGQDAAQRFYLSAGGALVIPADVHAEVGGRTSVGSNGGMDVAFDAGHGLVLVAGYGQKWGIRGELELGYRTFAIDRLSRLRLGDLADPGPFGAAGDVTSFSLMGNFVSSLDLGPLNFYVGGGIGMARVEAQLRPLRAGALASLGGSGRDDVLAWQLFTGFQHHLSDDVSASLGYRYFATEDARFGSTVAPVESHNLEVSVTRWLN